MSTPRNHHYISQVHIKNFFNEQNEIYLYNKSSKLFQTKKSSKRIFSEKDLNTKYEDGLNDYTTIEQQLNQYYENDFDFYYKNILKLIADKNVNIEAQTALLYLARYGAIANFRNPTYKANLETIFFNALKPVMDNAVNGLKKSFYDFFNNRGDSKYLGGDDYLQLGNEIISKMGLIYFIIEIPENKDDYFILPDFGAATHRKKINPYFNPDIEEIAYISLPLSSKIYIHFYSGKHPEGINTSGIKKLNSEQMYYINRHNLLLANEIVACENKQYLENLTYRVYSNQDL
ncbi:DUF4238 domain-containing protein [Chryseobacterium jejuense]|uniref:DUF4238 domain-containing protein n=1 Tax=Chryseobacterium jejuense TaxID=445960 RepID=A0A2X2VM53_CHRJE|nr:DUF4238 domain-containing protein [Chryseobacterium jejuense]SDJ11224.1 Protein of unknown function [Chryseobacterium jejuense]SQB27917.1 Uncharacterised protein [Chryseobacterium jejuense]